MDQFMKDKLPNNKTNESVRVGEPGMAPYGKYLKLQTPFTVST
jgi:hypothetical protein